MAEQTDNAKRYKKTLNLPKTPFPMRANLVQNEPASQKRWDKQKLYQQLREADHPAGPWVFHDGPPYANGDIHLGHLLNKCLKDFVVRSRSMMGHDCPFTPGWDCHGLPIEHKVMQDLGDKAREMEPIAVRRKCKTYAQKFVKTQRKQMERLLTLADYDDPYLTMLPKYEAAVLDVFATMVEKGVVYRGLKPVHWSIENQTALAEAELEYYDREDTSVFVKFPLASASESLGLADVRGVDLMIWTTTPWTLPANLAVAVHPRYEYGLYQLGERQVIVAAELAGKVFSMNGLEAPSPLATFKGEQLVGATYTHPFVEDGKARPVVAAEYVTLEDGTGMVHTAPGHGVEDYQTGLREGLEIYCPVQADGTFDDTAPDWLQGLKVWDANTLVCEKLEASGHMFHQHQFMHSYPHDWRGKTPVIFRATEQWFVSVDDEIQGEGKGLRQLAEDHAASEVAFHPAWGKNRLKGMLESRPDWCLSRQRSWGLPIPAFYSDQHQPLLTPASVKAVASVFEGFKDGSDAWFLMEPAQLLEGYDPSADPDAPDWAKAPGFDLAQLNKGHDTFDVWFESGSSWNAVLRKGWADKQAKGATEAFPSELYLEGSDQHRGWFQHSLLPALAATGKPPFKTILTHGFMVDKDGKKMSKSLGNTLNVEDLMKDFGADVCRWWVASLNTDNDIKVDLDFFKTAGEEYRKVRNTVRFLLSNLSDFDPKQHAHSFTDADATSLDAWVMGEYVAVAQKVKAAYEGYRFRELTRLLFNFCNETLSAVYLAAAKDRMYCDAPDARRRRRAQSAMYRIASGLARLLAPIMPHTADEAWRALHGAEQKSEMSVHLEHFPSLSGCSAIPVSAAWADVMAQRDAWLREIEGFRQRNDIDNPLDLGVLAPGPASFEAFDPVDLADLLGVSRFALIRPDEASTDATDEQRPDDVMVVDLREQPRCDRSWKRDGTVKQRSDGGMLSDRDAIAVGV